MSRLTAAQQREVAAARAQKIEEARKRLCHRSIVTIFRGLRGERAPVRCCAHRP